MEGKTTVTSNLGIAFAGINHKVLLIDGDLRKPRLHEIFGVSNDYGLSTVLGEEPIDCEVVDRCYGRPGSQECLSCRAVPRTRIRRTCSTVPIFLNF